jgi:hypothetical protein
MDCGLVVENASKSFTGETWDALRIHSQGKIPKGGVVTPVILVSDKTQLTQFGGDKKAWPVYLTIGNIAKAQQ